MDPSTVLQPQPRQQVGDATVRLGAWLFAQRTWLPVPLAVLILLLPPNHSSTTVLFIGLALVAAGEGLRMLAVRHIGVVSRTRIDRSGPLVASGPFALVRNPLYLGNIALWVGFTMSAGLLWFAPVVLLLLGFEYHAIVRWEETLLESRLGDAYRAYAARVPRWLPRFESHGDHAPRFSWSETLFSERGTLIAIAAGCVLVWVKLRWY